MPVKLFLTGEKQIGKSTAIRRFLEDYKGPVEGFITQKATDVIPGEISVHLLKVADNEIPSSENLLFCPKGDRRDAVVRFNRLGPGALAVVSPQSLIMMDELGPAEGNALEFQQAVLDTLQGDHPVLGVLQQCDAPWIETIIKMPGVALKRVTESNRDEIPLFLKSCFQKNEK